MGALSTFRIASESFAGDEAFSYFYSQRSLRDVWALFGDGMPLYYLLLKLWSALFGTSEAALRSFSALFATASVPALYAFARTLTDRWTSHVTTWFFASNAFVIYYAQYARSYALLLFLSICSSLLFVKAVQDQSRRFFFGYAVTTVLAVYTHAFAVWLLVAHAASCAFLNRPNRPLKPLALTYAGVLLAITPLLFAAQNTRSSESFWLSSPSPEDLVYVFFKLSGGQEVYGLAWFALVAAVALLALRQAMREVRRYGRSIAAWRRGLVWTSILAPVVGSFAISFARPMFVERYLLVVVPAVAVAVGIGMRAIPNARVAAAVIVLAPMLVAGNLYVLQTREDNENWRGAAKLVVDQVQPGDGLMLNGVMGFDYYLPDHDWSRSLPGVARIDPESLDPYRQPPPELTESRMTERSATSSRVWLVTRHSVDRHTRMRQLLLDTGYLPITQRDLKGIQVDLFDRNG